MSDDNVIPPWQVARDRLSIRRGQKRHHRSEQDLASGGGAMQVNSGRLWHSKRDVKKFDFLFENRQTDGKTITVNAPELQKIGREAVFEHSLPAMRLDFSKYHEDWVLIRRGDFEEQNQLILQLEGLVADLEKQLDERQSEV